MTGKEFLQNIANGKKDIVQVLLDLLAATGSDYCIIGGLAVNAYAEPVVSLDIDIVVAAENTEELCKAAEASALSVERFQHSINLAGSDSDLRIQLQTDARYQDFISRGKEREVLGYKMNVASIEDVLRGKLWAYSDEKRRKSKRQKDLADIMRMVEANPALVARLPAAIREELK